ncbi:MAG TPA: hypothetical protein VEM41_13180 [Actinomycetota bacterium]|nr:hypothetical protein [Actinomycetota bacterium]
MSFLARPLPSLFDTRQRRQTGLADFAKEQGLQFSTDDPIGLVDRSLEIFRLSPYAQCANVVWGTWQGLAMATADLRLGRGDQAYKGKTYSIAVVDLGAEASLPEVMISRGKPPMEIRAMPPIEFESEQFNRSLQVRSKDREFAFRFVDPQMMGWLLSADPRFGFQAGGRKLLVHAHPLPPAGLIPLLGTTKGFHDHVPDLVLHGGEGAVPQPGVLET